MRDLQSTRRSLVRYIPVEDDRAESGLSVKPHVKYALALVALCVASAGAIALTVRGGTLRTARSGVAISRASALVPVGTNATSCEVHDDLKVNCGPVGIDRPSCAARGCCYHPSRVPGIPWCFVTADNMDKKCTVPRQDKVDCGFRGILEQECEARGCCFANAGAQTVPWCFKRPGKDLPKPKMALPVQCAVPGTEKLECGFPGITKRQCLGKGCCYERTGAVDEPYCFQAWMLVTGTEAEEAEECGTAEGDRIECGFDGISSTQCRRRGCCYERTGDEGVPFCFRKTNRRFRPGDKAVAEECAVPDRERFDCGWKGVLPEDCRSKGCCYAPAATTGAPYCFYKETTEAGPPIRLPKNTTAAAQQAARGQPAGQPTVLRPATEEQEQPAPRSEHVTRTTLLVSGALAALGAVIGVAACVLAARQPTSEEEAPPEGCAPAPQAAPEEAASDAKPGDGHPEEGPKEA